MPRSASHQHFAVIAIVSVVCAQCSDSDCQLKSSPSGGQCLGNGTTDGEEPLFPGNEMVSASSDNEMVHSSCPDNHCHSTGDEEGHLTTTVGQILTTTTHNSSTVVELNGKTITHIPSTEIELSGQITTHIPSTEIELTDHSLATTACVPSTSVELNGPDGSKTYVVGARCIPSTAVELDGPDGSKVYLVGARHFTDDGRNDVLQTIFAVQPKVVVFEVCDFLSFVVRGSSFNLLFSTAMAAIGKMLRLGLLHGLLSFMALESSLQDVQRVDIRQGIESGSPRLQLRTAYDELKRTMSGTDIVFGDVPISVTWARIFATSSVWQVLRFGYRLRMDPDYSQRYDETQPEQQKAFIRRFADDFPQLERVLIRERDVYLTWQLQLATERAVRRCAAEKRALEIAARRKLSVWKRFWSWVRGWIPDWLVWKRSAYRPKDDNDNDGDAAVPPCAVVGVVGAGHVAGIVRHWGNVSAADIQPLFSVPRLPFASRVVCFIVDYFFLRLLAYDVWLLVLLITLKLMHLQPFQQLMFHNYMHRAWQVSAFVSFDLLAYWWFWL